MYHNHGLMKWLMLACIIPILLVFFLGNKNMESWSVYALLGVCVVSHVLMMFSGHKDEKPEPSHAGQHGPEKEINS